MSLTFGVETLDFRVATSQELTLTRPLKPLRLSEDRPQSRATPVGYIGVPTPIFHPALE